MSGDALVIACALWQPMSASNPKTSLWYSTPNALRTRKCVTITMTDVTRAKLDALAKERGESRSDVIEALVDALDAETKRGAR